MIQASLFAESEHGRARRRDPDTAKRAAKSVDAKALESRIVASLKNSLAGFTTHELSRELDVPLVSISPRMAPLVQKNLVRNSGQTRETETGRKAIVWKAV